MNKIIKKISLAAVLVALTVSSVPVYAAESNEGFDDVKADDYFSDAVSWAVENGITEGWTEKLFAPDRTCTRGQVVTFLWRANECPEAENTAVFDDVASDAYYAKAVAWAVENKITEGWTEKLFAPARTVTRGQAVTILWRADECPKPTEPAAFTDVDSEAYYADAVAWAVENKITEGWTEDTFAPEMGCTRAQVVTFLFRADDITEIPDEPVADDSVYSIYPIPQSISYEGYAFELTDEVVIVAEEGIDEYTMNFVKEILTDYEVNFVTAERPSEGKTNILLGIEGSGEYVDVYADEIVASDDLYTRNDAYMLDAKDGCIVIEGKDTDSVYYGVATLQMLFASFDGEKFVEAHVEDYASVATRGYIEGFYGAWNFDEREDLMRFGRTVKMNSYVYAAKGDAYHTNKWAELYPADTLAQLEHLVQVGEETKVKFAWSIHLGSFFGSFSGTNDANFASQYAKLTAKLDQLIGIGVRKIDVLNDDFGSGSHETVVEVLNMLNGYLKEKGCEPLTYCPQGYNRAWSGNGAELAALQKLDKDINIYWTGDDVNSPITQSTVDFLTEKSGHAPDFWLNYPVNEHAKTGIFLGDITYYARDNVTGLAGFHSNPCRYAYANEVGLYQLGCLVWNNNDYSEYAQEVWESAFDFLQPEVKDSYFKIASNISNAPNSSRVPGFNESEYLADTIEAVKTAIESGDSLAENADVQMLLREFQDIVSAITDFRENCTNRNLVEELDPWMNCLNDIADAGAAALESLIALDQGDASTGWEKLSAASRSYDTAYTYQVPAADLAGSFANAGSKRLAPFVSMAINTAKNELSPILNPSDDTVDPVLYAVIGGRELAADSNGRKMYDGDVNTYAGWTIVQQQGDFFGLDLGRVITVRDIEILQGTTDTHHDIFHKAVLQYSEDGEHWTDLTEAVVELDGHKISIDGLNVKARYVRYYLTETGTANKPDYWTYVREFTVNKKIETHDRVYTNIEALKKTPLTFEGAEVSVRNLENVTLASGEYIGIKLDTPAAASAFVKDITADGLNLECSYNEIVWKEADEISDSAGVRYLRLINKTGAAVTTDITKIGMTLKYLTADPSYLTGTTAGLAEGKYENLFDGDLSTYVLTSGSQTKDTYVTFDLGKMIEVHDVTAVTSDGAQRFYDAKIQISEDNAVWTDVAEVVNDNSVFEVPYRYVRGDGEGANARYMRILFTGTNSNPLKLYEIRINANAEAGAAAAQIVSSMTGNLNAAVDKNIATLFAANAKTGDYIEYRLIDNAAVTQVSVLQGTAGNAKIYAVTASGKELLGTLNKSVAVFDTSEIEALIALRIEWEAEENAAIHELSISLGDSATDDIGEYVELVILDGGQETPITNIALGKTVTVSGTSDGNKDYVVDGNTATKWDSNFIKSGQQDIGDAWVAVDLGKSSEIHQIIVRYFNKIYPTSWKVQVSDDGAEWTDVTDELTKENNGPTHPVETVDFETAVTCRYVRLYFNTLNTAAAGNGVGVTEFEVYGRAAR
ncbi:MAG: beta-N-acetylglucosaminidase domain-containing protein [Lachnospiraceae bacterium]